MSYRSLDYCSELLSLVSKLASIYAQNFPDGTVVSAINELENLTTGLSRKIWQKIVILQGSNPKLAVATPKPKRAARQASAKAKPKARPTRKPPAKVPADG